MNNSTLVVNYNNESFTFSSTLVATVYLCEAIPAPIINVLVLLVIFFKRQDFQNDFFFYNIDMLIADSLCIISVGLYTSVCIIFKSTMWNYLQRVMSVLIDIGWYPKSIFLVFVTYTRCQIFRPSIIKKRLYNKTTYATVGMVWVLFLLITAYYIVSPEVTILDLTINTWYYNPTTDFGIFLTKYNAIHNIVVSALVVLFNFLTVVYLYLRNAIKYKTSLKQTRTPSGKIPDSGCIFNVY